MRTVLSGRMVAAVAVAVLALAGCTSEAPTSPMAVPDEPFVAQLRDAMTTDGAVVHLQALQRIADENGGNRATGRPGYDASVDYVVGVLRGAGFDVQTPTYEATDEESGQERTSRNVVAQTATGDPGRVVVVGAHLDSVLEGPGIIDNGSGVAALLELATRLGARPDVDNAVQFAFFGDEETGLLGSKAYVRDADRQAIQMYLNVDMVASINGGFIVQGGVGDDVDETGPEGSALIAQVMVAQFAAIGETAEVVEFVGDDDASFVEAGIPTGGMENGDAMEKTEEQARLWGGQAGADFDPCYHQACDRIDQVNRDILTGYLRAAAGTVAHFATSAEPLR